MIHRLVKFQNDTRLEYIWLTIYADLVTNMMLVFLALYGLTLMSTDALSRAVQSMKLGEGFSLKETDLDFSELAPAFRQKFRYTPEVKITDAIGAVRIEFGENILFESGRAEPKKSAETAIQAVSAILKSIPQTVVVEGHTDSVPLQTGSRYRDNNELSMARAMAVVRLLIKEGLPPAQISAAAYGSSRPCASNSTALGRNANRRVEIALFKDFPYGDQSK